MNLSTGACLLSIHRFYTYWRSLKSELATLITSSHSSFEYTSNSSTDTWDIIKSSDTYLLDSTKVFLVYGYDDFDQAFQNDLSRDKSLSCHGSPCDGLYNREHVYAKSLANPSLSTSFSLALGQMFII